MIPKVGDIVRVKACLSLTPTQQAYIGKTYKVVGIAHGLYTLDVPVDGDNFLLSELELVTVGPLISPPAALWPIVTNELSPEAKQHVERALINGESYIHVSWDAPVCECGAEKSGVGGHSAWCPKFEAFKETA